MSGSGQSADPSAAVRSLRLRILGVLFLREVLTWSAGWMFLWGVGVLALRFSLRLPRAELAWGVLGLGAAGAVAAWVAARRWPSPVAVSAVVDRAGRAGGLIMAADDVELGPWRGRIRPVATPAVTFRHGRSLALFALALLFVATGFALPPRALAIPGPAVMDVSRETGQLAAQIDVLEEETLLDEKAADDLELEVRRLAEQATADNPARTWEALDHLADRLRQTAQQASDEALAQTGQMTDAQTLTQALAQDGSGLGEQRLAEAMSELAAMLQQAGAENQALAKELPESLLEAIRNGQCDAAALARIAGRLNLEKTELLRRVEKLAAAKLIDARCLSECRKAGECSGQDLCEMLAACQDLSVCDVVAQVRNKCAWGINRGRGDADMIWKQPSSEEDARFEEQVLPPASVAALKESRMIGVSVGAPAEADGPAASEGGALAGAAAGGGSASRQPVLPRHRGTVERFFNRTDNR